MEDARAGLQKLVGRAGPGGETPHLSLSCFPVIHSNRLWRWVYMEEELGEDAPFKKEWGELGFGTGHEGEELDVVSDALGTDAQEGPSSPERAQVGTRGGRGHWRYHVEQIRAADAQDAADNYRALFGTSHEPPAHPNPNHGEQDTPPFRAEDDLGAPETENEGFGESEDISSVPGSIAQNNTS